MTTIKLQRSHQRADGAAWTQEMLRRYWEADRELDEVCRQRGLEKPVLIMAGEACGQVQGYVEAIHTNSLQDSERSGQIPSVTPLL